MYDFIGRFGGEEFLILLPETQKEAEETAARLRLEIEENPVIAGNHEIYYTISIGAVSLIPHPAVTFDLLCNAIQIRLCMQQKKPAATGVEFFQG